MALSSRHTGSLRLRLEQTTVKARGLTFPALSCGTGELVLCLHGFPDSRDTFRHQLPALAAAGYRAVAPQLRGYAPGCLPPLAHCNPLEVARDAVAIVQALGHTHAHLVGHDWGAVSAYLAAALSPDTWLSMSTLAVPHPLALLRALKGVPRQLRLSWYMLFFQLPVAERAVRAGDFALLEKLWRDWSPGLSLTEDELSTMKGTFREPGVLQAALAYYRNMLRVTPTREARALLERTRIAVRSLLLTGADDGCIDTRMYDAKSHARYFENVRIERVERAGHFLHRETPERVNELLLGWFASAASPGV